MTLGGELKFKKERGGRDLLKSGFFVLDEKVAPLMS